MLQVLKDDAMANAFSSRSNESTLSSVQATAGIGPNSLCHICDIEKVLYVCDEAGCERQVST